MNTNKKSGNVISRRNFCAGVAVAGAALSGFAMTGIVPEKDKPTTNGSGKNAPVPKTDYYSMSNDLERMVLLRSSPIAIKMLKDESGIPEGAIRPKKDEGHHYAMCQAISLARHQGKTLAMFIEDHWCFEPIVSYGLVEMPENYKNGFVSSFFIADKEAALKRDSDIDRLPVGKYDGLVLGPLAKANFSPDLVMIYCNTGQLRHLLFSLMHVKGCRVTSTFDPIGSCVHSVVPSLLKNECTIAVPDPGDYERGMAEENEMILTIPGSKMKELMDGLYHFENQNMGYKHFSRTIQPDFPQPPFYQDYFQQWGLDGPVK